LSGAPRPLAIDPADMKRLRAILLLAAACSIALLCAACAEGGAGSPGSGSITMYGTLDEGVTFVRH